MTTNNGQTPIESMVGKGRLIAALLLLYTVAVLALALFLGQYKLVSDESIGEMPELVHEQTDKPDFNSIDQVKARKKAFFDFLRPAIQANNEYLSQQRTHLLAIKERWEDEEKISKKELKFLRKLSQEYNLDEEQIENTDQRLRVLLRRVDTIPEGLVLAQAAIESAWGTSRFAREGNNFFGEWCYKKGCGIIPSARLEDANHEVATFDTVADSVNSYFQNLNTYHAYQELRSLRSVLRMSGKPITASKLAAGLTRYSERREEYVEEVRKMIRINKLEKPAPIEQAAM